MFQKYKFNRLHYLRLRLVWSNPLPTCLCHYIQSLSWFKELCNSKNKHLDWRIALTTKFQFPAIPPVNSHILKLFKMICSCNRHYLSDYSFFNHRTVHMRIFIFDTYDDVTALMTLDASVQDTCVGLVLDTNHVCFWLAVLQPLTTSLLHL